MTSTTLREDDDVLPSYDGAEFGALWEKSAFTVEIDIKAHKEQLAREDTTILKVPKPRRGNSPWRSVFQVVVSGFRLWRR